MALMLVCGALLAAGIGVTARWSGERLLEPGVAVSPAPGARPRVEALRRYLWWASVLTVTGTTTGVLVAGAGGRLAMRLLAATSPQSTGRLTEGSAVIGRITTEGSLAFLVFGALPLAFASSALFLLVSPWLPRGRWAGVAFGAVLLVTVAPFVDPLRPDNVDFVKLGPGWLAVLVLAALTVLQGAAVTAIASRLSRSLPLLERGNLTATGPPLLLAALLVPVGILLSAVGLVVTALPRLLPTLLAARASRTGVLVGRGLLIGVVLATMPAFVGAVVSIASSSSR